MHYISIELKENYLDTTCFIVEIYKHWEQGRDKYQRLLCSLPNIPKYQAIAMKGAISKASSKDLYKDNVIRLVRN
jgi:hypothetical protein